jgi:hypothetical protein
MTRWLLPIAVLLTFTACAPAPPTLSPTANAAFTKTRVIKTLDLLRDAAVSAEAQTPPLLSTATARRVVLAHQAALQVMQATDAGWEPTVQALLSGILANLPADEVALLKPYVNLAQSLLGTLV